MFQYPHGDSFFSDPPCHRRQSPNERYSFQYPHGDSFFSDTAERLAATAERLGFNTLTGIRSFLTLTTLTTIWTPRLCFNTLTGIRSFLTEVECRHQAKAYVFQYPHGDSFFSDVLRLRIHAKISRFQYPHGDSFFSDGVRSRPIARRARQVSIPSRGFVLF